MVTACRPLLDHPVGASVRVSRASSVGSPDRPACRRRTPLPSLGRLHLTGPPLRRSRATPADHRQRLREAGASGAAPRTTRHRLKKRARLALLTRARLIGGRIGRPVSRPLSHRLSVSVRTRHPATQMKINRRATLHLRHQLSPDWTRCSSRIPMSRPRMPRLQLPRSARPSRRKLRAHRPTTPNRRRSQPNLRPSLPKPSDSQNPSPRDQ